MNQVLRRFLKDPNVAAITPTSKFAVRKICEKIDFSRDLCFVEYGPGDGVLSKEILSRMTSNSSFTGIEANADFVCELETIQDARFKVVKGDARDARRIVRGKIDVVLSSIPCTFLSTRERKALAQDTYNMLAPGGLFIVFQYSPLMKRHMEDAFGNAELSIVPINVPAIFIMLARKTA